MAAWSGAIDNLVAKMVAEIMLHQTNAALLATEYGETKKLTGA
jgi:hypothetical protein